MRSVTFLTVLLMLTLAACGPSSQLLSVGYQVEHAIVPDAVNERLAEAQPQDLDVAMPGAFFKTPVPAALPVSTAYPAPSGYACPDTGDATILITQANAVLRGTVRGVEPAPVSGHATYYVEPENLGVMTDWNSFYGRSWPGMSMTVKMYAPPAMKLPNIGQIVNSYVSLGPSFTWGGTAACVRHWEEVR